jgi:hypothetical protein
MLDVGFGPEFGDDLSIHRDCSYGDQFLGIAPRSDSGSGNDFL